MVSAVILVTLALQAIYTMLPALHGAARVTAGQALGNALADARRFLNPPTLFPFFDYPMYSRPRYAGDGIRRDVVLATLADSSAVRVRHEDVGMGYWLFNANVVRAIRDADRERIDELATILEARHGQPVIGLRLENHPLIIERHRFQEAPPVIEAQVRVGGGVLE